MLCCQHLLGSRLCRLYCRFPITSQSTLQKPVTSADLILQLLQQVSKKVNWTKQHLQNCIFSSCKLYKLARVLICCLVASGHLPLFGNDALCSILVPQSCITVYFIMFDLHGETVPMAMAGLCCESLVCLQDSFLTDSMSGVGLACAVRWI